MQALTSQQSAAAVNSGLDAGDLHCSEVGAQRRVLCCNSGLSFPTVSHWVSFLEELAILFF